jgi:hypothetical protein
MLRIEDGVAASTAKLTTTTILVVGGEKPTIKS